MEKHLSVTTLTKYLKMKFDKDPYLERVYLTGQVSNFRKRPTHQYFSLKDDHAVIQATIWSGVYQKLGFDLEEGMKMLAKTKEKFNVPVITDVHEAWQCKEVAKVVDILQIPAFLCRQTDLLIAAAETGKAVNIKKGQFLAPWDMKNIVVKMEESGNKNIMLCERGSTFGYNNMVVDMRSLLEMRKFNYPVVFDVTHSVQKPGGLGTATSGDREYVYPLLRAGLAIGVDAIFAEVHPNPTEAKSDGPNMLYLKDLEETID